MSGEKSWRVVKKRKSVGARFSLNGNFVAITLVDQITYDVISTHLYINNCVFRTRAFCEIGFLGEFSSSAVSDMAKNEL